MEFYIFKRFIYIKKKKKHTYICCISCILKLFILMIYFFARNIFVEPFYNQEAF